jgi:hypothetical protein
VGNGRGYWRNISSMSAAAQSVDSIEKVRVLVSFEGRLRSLCKIMFSKPDASIYVVPYAPTKKYSVGTHTLGKDEQSATFTVEGEQDFETAPKISFHESGQVHANAGTSRVGPLYVPALPYWRGANLGTVVASHAGSLPEFNRAPRTEGPERDWTLHLTGPVVSAALALYVNGFEPRFDTDCPLHFALTRPTLLRPLYLGLRPRPQDPLTAPEQYGGGVIAIGGWTPGQPGAAAVDFIYVRGV